MMIRVIISSLLCISLCSCGMLSDSNSDASDIALGAVVGTAAGAGIGAAIGSAITNGNVEKSLYLGAGVGLAVGAVGTYAYREIKVRNTIIDNDEKIATNKSDIVTGQSEVDRLREEVLADSYNIQVEQGRLTSAYDGTTIGNYYR
jgi:hypothetical protein